MEHRKNIVVVLKGLILHKGTVLIVQRAPDDEVGGGTWELVGGGMRFGEELEAALIREIEEEVGLTVTVKKVLYAATFQTHPTRQVVILTYLCTSEQHEVILSKEHIHYCWATKDEARQLLPPTIVYDFEKNGVFSLAEWR
ncbi:NUDIX domain-containing protein [Geobacillus sp. FSL W8-0032]|uniref:8-oxo-dGTP diphosphatase n=1 Tax=Geobacillus icigianus TaxID=1430331 RepID=A0ABU6BHW7_9BACL|nr:NUDIX domain-containing protein [Geobacillus icigianus]MEB3751580.1 CTP pyrophosphohydrolase [Geobacillus icigianus]